jgi:glucose/arabinose dehydrogenase
MNPEGIAVAPDGSVYVSETGNNDRIQKFSVGP